MDMIGLKDYQALQAGVGGAAFGSHSQETVDLLQKALLGGSGRGSAGTTSPGDGGVLRPESLERTLKILTYRQKHIKFWKEINKEPAYNIFEEYNLMNEVGGDSGAFTNEGELPEEIDSQYERKGQQVKFIGVVGQVTHPMMVVRTAHGPAVTREVENKTLWLMRQLEVGLFKGRSDEIPREWDGVFKQILDGVSISDLNTDLYSATDVIGGSTRAATVVYDLRGGKLTEDIVEDATEGLINNYGMPHKIWGAPKTMSLLAKQYYPRQIVQTPATSGRVGFAVKEIETQNGVVALEQDIFLRSGRQHGVKLAPTTATSTKAPSAPTLSAAGPGADAKSMFKAADAGTYYFTATALNRFGESVASASISALLAAGESVALTVTDGGGGNGATAYKIYRSPVGAADAASNRKYMTTVKRGGGGGAATTAVTDRNWLLPGTSFAWMAPESGDQTYTFRQLAPMMRMPLATVAPSTRWMQLLYGTPIVYAPQFNVLFINAQDS